ncbi:hypothetical protein [Photobacterium leiognathi]|uniref:hypothetical protein n=1 Tax=Photobacterium leiognathi TaxID=553611 RepID=UPI0029815BE5|nr:hypothetical protein [Photobacterium leiognathi]
MSNSGSPIDNLSIIEVQPVAKVSQEMQLMMDIVDQLSASSIDLVFLEEGQIKQGDFNITGLLCSVMRDEQKILTRLMLMPEEDYETALKSIQGIKSAGLQSLRNSFGQITSIHGLNVLVDDVLYYCESIGITNTAITVVEDKESGNKHLCFLTKNDGEDVLIQNFDMDLATYSLVVKNMMINEPFYTGKYPERAIFTCMFNGKGYTLEH